MKFAVTDEVAAKVKTQLVGPEQSPLQDSKESLVEGVAVRATCVFAGNAALHVDGQLMPTGVLVTVPVPLPERDTVSCSPALNAALTFSSPVMERLHDAVPEQAPVHPLKK